ncbi:hypothetical protein GCM10010433_05530 [Streptomyces pulveraceus]
MGNGRKQRKVKRRDPDWWIPILLATLTTVTAVAGCVSQLAQ